MTTSTSPSIQYSSLIEILRHQATNRPDKIAFSFLDDDGNETEHLTYAQVDLKARAVAQALKAKHVAGQPVLLLYPPCLEFIVGLFGCFYAGCIAVPVYPPDLKRLGKTLPIINAIAKDSGARVILTTSAIELALRGISLLPMRSISAFRNIKTLATEKLSSISAEKWHAPAVSLENLAMLQYTSGSTGMPKGVMLSHLNILDNIERQIRGIEGTEADSMVSWLPFYHNTGLFFSILTPTYAGASSIIMSPLTFLQNPFFWLQTISRFKGTVSGGPNIAYDLCTQTISEDQKATLDLSSWEVASLGAEKIHHGTLEHFTSAFKSCRFHKRAFSTGYGLTEATCVVGASLRSSLPNVISVDGPAMKQHRVVESEPEKEGTQTLIGYPHLSPDEKIRVVDPDSLVPCQPDEIGEIWISSPSVAQGYWKRPKETEETFQAFLTGQGEGPFLRTGDLGFLKDSHLFITGRIKELIIIRGKNHYPQDIERTVEHSHQSVRKHGTAAFSLEVNSEENLAVATEIKRGTATDREAIDRILDDLRHAVAEQHELHIHSLLLLKGGTIPKTMSGKIQRSECKRKYLEGQLNIIEESTISKAAGAAIRRGLSRLIVQPTRHKLSALKREKGHEVLVEYLRTKLADILNTDPDSIDIHKDLGSFGLDSLKVIELVDLIKGYYKTELNLEDLSSQSVRSLSAIIVDQMKDLPSHDLRIESMH